MSQTFYLDTHDASFVIEGLKDIWISKRFFVYRLIYKDTKVKKCIYWSFSKKTLEKAMKKILISYETGDYYLKLW